MKKYTHQNDLPLNARFLDKKKDIQSDGAVSSRWRLSSTTQIEALKSIIATLPIFTCGIATSITKAQQHTFSVLQALTMNRKLGSTNFEIPAGCFIVFSLLVLITWLPLYDRFIVPTTRWMTKNGRGIIVFQRMGIGLAISSLSMLVAGFVEIKRQNTTRSHALLQKCRKKAQWPCCAWWAEIGHRKTPDDPLYEMPLPDRQCRTVERARRQKWEPRQKDPQMTDHAQTTFKSL